MAAVDPDVDDSLAKKLAARAFERLEAVEVELGMQYKDHDGHHGAVTCIDASEGMDYLTTGGADGTVRLWGWDDSEYQCYRLVAKLEHSAPLKSVDFVGIKGPVVSVTDAGDLFMWNVRIMKRPQMTKKFMGDGKVTDSCARNGMVDEILSCCAMGTDVKLIEAKPEGDGYGYTFESTGMLAHESDVVRVKYIARAAQNLYEHASVVSLAGGTIHLWNLGGQLLHKIVSPQLDKVRCFTVSPRHDDVSGLVWIIGGNGEGDSGMVHLWPLEHGELIQEDGAHVKLGASPPPLVSYHSSGGLRDVALDPDNQFIVLTGTDYSTEVMMITPSEPSDAVAQTGPGRLVVQQMKERFFCQIEPRCKVHEMIAKRDADANEPVLMAGFEDGSCVVWDLEVSNAGEIFAEVRNLSHTEKVLPVALFCISFLQVVSFAFGPQTKWSKDVLSSAESTRSAVLLDVDFKHMSLHVDRELIFWVKATSAVCVMIIFIGVAVAGIPGFLSRRLSKAIHSEAYREEAERGGFGCGHFGALLLRGTKMFLGGFMLVSSTILVVSMFKICAHCFDCVPTTSRNDHTTVLLTAPAVTCYVGRHRILAYALEILIPIYFIVLMPYAAVSGDVAYVQRDELCSPFAWRGNVIRASTLIFQGFSHPNAKSIFASRLMEHVFKIALPCITILATSHPQLQCASCAAMAGLMFLVSLLFPPFIDPVWCAIVQGSKLFTLCAMLCGWLTMFVSDDRRSSVTLLLIPSALLVIAFIFCRVYCGKRDQTKAYLPIATNSSVSPRIISLASQP